MDKMRFQIRNKKSLKIVIICGTIICIVISLLMLKYLTNFSQSHDSNHDWHLRRKQPNQQKSNREKSNREKSNREHSLQSLLVKSNLTRRTDLKEFVKRNNIKNITSTKSISLKQKPTKDNKRFKVFKPITKLPTKNSSMTLNYNAHIFYYPWYGNPQIDQRYIHWNHDRILHWDAKKRKGWPSGKHVPPIDVAASFYPSLGAYSSRDPDVIKDHMKQIVEAGTGVVVVSWYPPVLSDDNGEPVDGLMPLIMDIADTFKIKVAFHIEPYKDRNAANLRQNIVYIINKYGEHAAFYRHHHKGKSLPIFYIYDSYLTPSSDWNTIFSPNGQNSIRGTEYDAIFIGLLVQQKEKDSIVAARFDGFYTYFAVDGFTYGSTHSTWPRLSKFAQNHNLIFIPSIGPGYIDTEVRPWNNENTRDRDNGKYYESSFKAALDDKVSPKFVSITSFNEWHEGTQIEKAIPKIRNGEKYLDYLPNESDYYLKLTRKWLEHLGQ